MNATLALFASLSLVPMSSPSLNDLGGPLRFEPNRGQAGSRALFVARTTGGVVTFDAGGVTVVLRAQASSPAVPVRLELVGASGDVVLEGKELERGTVNYLRGKDPARWQRNLPTFGAIAYSGLYPGVDLTYEGTGRGALKGTFTVAPGASPAAIRWRYPRAAVTLDESGDLRITPCDGAGAGPTIVEPAPVSWQVVGGEQLPVASRYVLADDGTVGIELGPHDPSRVLVIDPTLTYSTYFGGSIAEQPWGMALDGLGNSYVTGYTASTNFPAIDALQQVAAGQGDAFVVKFDATGAPVYSTYLGGDYLDTAYGIAVDGQGSAYVTGFTGSADFPVAGAFQPSYAGNWDAFVTKLAPDGGSIVYSTYLGGTSFDNGLGIAVDPAGNAVVSGDTQSGDFPTQSPLQPQHAGTGSTDAFIAKLDASGNALVYSTFLGGAFGGESALEVAVDAAGAAYATGFTTSSDFPTAHAAQPACAPGAAGCWDVFVTKVAPDGRSLAYSTFLGGNDTEYVDRGMAITTDADGNAYVTGFTGSPNFPVTGQLQPFYGGQIDVFVSKLGSGGALLYSTFLGGSNSDVGGAIAVDDLGDIHVGGLTISADFPVADAIQPALGGFEDAFVAKIEDGGQLLGYSTYLGGTDDREEYGVIGMGVDAAGNAYVAASSSATDFPVVDAYQPANRGSYDLVFAIIADPPCMTVAPPALADGVEGIPYAETLTALGGAPPYTWAVTSGSLPPGLALGAGTGVIDGTPTSAGTHAFTATATDSTGSCRGARAYVIEISVAVAHVLGEGLGPSNGNLVRVHGRDGTATATSFAAYASGQWGTNVASGDLDGATYAEILTGPGPGAVYGPHVRAWRRDGAAIAKVSFYAYGTLRYGANVAAGLLDADGFDEVLTGPGPGTVFGPHVRAFDYDGSVLAPVSKVNFFAYGTLRYGVNVEEGSVDTDTFAEILTGAGPGAVFGATVKGFDYDGTAVAAIAGLNFNAFPTSFGVNVAGGDADGDGFAEIAAAQGPAPTNANLFAGFDHDGAGIRAAPGFTVTPSPPSLYGGRVGTGDLTGDGRAELQCGAGRDPGAGSTVNVFSYTGAALVPVPPAFTPFTSPGYAYGVNVAGGALGLF